MGAGTGEVQPSQARQPYDLGVQLFPSKHHLLLPSQLFTLPFLFQRWEDTPVSSLACILSPLQPRFLRAAHSGPGSVSSGLTKPFLAQQQRLPLQ